MAFPIPRLFRLLLAGAFLGLGGCIDDGISPLPQGSASSPVTVGSSPDYWPDAGWQTASPESQGFQPGTLDTLAADAAAALPYHTSLLVIRNGWIVHESYHDTESATIDADTRHHVFSITKSVTSMILGRAWTLGDLDAADLDTSAASVFPASVMDTLPPADPRRGITLRHALQMRSGLAWNERAWLLRFAEMKDPLLRSYLGYDTACPTGSYSLLCSVLQQPAAYAPGAVWNYNTYDTYLVSAFFTGLTGQALNQYAADNLFTPIGLTFNAADDWENMPSTSNITFGGAGLTIRSRDLARLGMLMLYDGNWNGKQLIDKDWITLSTTAQGSGPMALFEADGNPRTLTDSDPLVDIPYALQWWRTTVPDLGGTPALSARGLGGQMLHIFKDQELIILITCDSNDLESDRSTPINAFLQTHILDKLAI